MNNLKNIFAVFGVICFVALTIAVIRLKPMMDTLDSFDPRARQTFLHLFVRTLETQSAAEAMVKKVKVADGLTADDVDTSIHYIANELNIKNVGELPLYKEIEALSDSPYRFIKIYLLCNAMTAASMINYSDAYSSFLPCRVTLIEDQQGQLWLYTMDMDMMIYGGKPLPPAMKEEAEKVQDIISEVMNRAAQGDF